MQASTSHDVGALLAGTKKEMGDDEIHVLPSNIHALLLLCGKHDKRSTMTTATAGILPELTLACLLAALACRGGV